MTPSSHLCLALLTAGRVIAMLALAAALVASSAPISTATPGYPTRPITMIIPVGTGSAPDITFRKLASQAAEKLGQPIVIKDRPGGDGLVGLSELAQARADGYTIGMSGVAIVAIVPHLVTSRVLRGPQDIQPVIQVDFAPFALFTRVGNGIDSVRDLVARAKTRPGRVRMGIALSHDLTALNAALFERAAGIQLNKVALGAGKQVLAVLNATVDVAVAQPVVVKPYIDSYRMRYLGLFTPTRVPGVDTLPMKELGYDVHEVPYEFVVAPRGTPQEIVRTLHDTFKAAMGSEAFRDYTRQVGILWNYVGTEQLARNLATDYARYGELIARLGWR